MMNPTKKIKPLLSLRVFLPAVIEVWVVRRFAHRAFGADNLQMGVHGSDIYIPLAIGLSLIFLLGQRKSPVTIELQPKSLGLNLFCFLSCLAVCWQHAFLQSTAGHTLTIALFLTLALATFLSSFFVLLSPKEILAACRKESSRVLYFMAAILLLVAYPVVLETMWKTLALCTGYACYVVLNLVGISVQRPSVLNSLKLWNPDFAAYLNMGCSGLEGIFFFLSAFVMVSAYEGKPFSARRTIAQAIGGCVLMFLLNVFRISVFFAGVVWMERNLPTWGAREAFEWAFHANIGWTLYLAGMWWYFTRWVLTPQAEP